MKKEKKNKSYHPLYENKEGRGEGTEGNEKIVVRTGCTLCLLSGEGTVNGMMFVYVCVRAGHTE